MKRWRLQEARQLILNINAGRAGGLDRHEIASQFSGECNHLFALAPQQDAGERERQKLRLLHPLRSAGAQPGGPRASARRRQSVDLIDMVDMVDKSV